MMTGLINPNSRRLERSLFICSGEWVRALFTYGTNFVIDTNCISVVVFAIALSLHKSPFGELFKATYRADVFLCDLHDLKVVSPVNGLVSDGA